MTLALIAGRGSLPDQIAAAQKTTPLVCGYEGMLPDRLEVHLTYRLETLGTLLNALEQRGVTQVCFCGGIERPQLDPTLLDAATIPLVPLFQKALAAGDDGALRVLKDIFQQKGFEVVGADTLLPCLVAVSGVLSAKQPDDQMRRDAASGMQVLAALAPLDIGQACVVGRAQVLGIETMGGTDHLLSSLPPQARQMTAVLCKAPKTGQLREIDMPTVGPDTLDAAQRAGLAGVVIATGSVLLLEPERCIALANSHGLVLWSRDAGEA